MARLPRFVIAGQPQHIILRGNNRDAIFGSDADYLFLLEKLQAACEKHDVQLHAYVLMTNHLHFLMTPGQDNSLSKAMQMLGRYYVQYFNFTHRRTGTLFEGRYKASLIDSETYLLSCMRYIELNPVRAAMVGHPSEYPWSSYRHNALGEANELIVAHNLYQRLGRNAEQRQAAYRQLFKNHLSELLLTQIRESTNKSWVLGTEQFKRNIESQVTRRVEPAARGGNRKSELFRINRV